MLAWFCTRETNKPNKNIKYSTTVWNPISCISLYIMTIEKPRTFPMCLSRARARERGISAPRRRIKLRSLFFALSAYLCRAGDFLERVNTFRIHGHSAPPRVYRRYKKPGWQRTRPIVGTTLRRSALVIDVQVNIKRSGKRDRGSVLTRRSIAADLECDTTREELSFGSVGVAFHDNKRAPAQLILARECE